MIYAEGARANRDSTNGAGEAAGITHECGLIDQAIVKASKDGKSQIEWDEIHPMIEAEMQKLGFIVERQQITKVIISW